MDGRFEARGIVDTHAPHGETVSPENSARATSACLNCKSVAFAVQVILYRRGARSVTPRNSATAMNDHCSGCTTLARAIQYVIPVDNVDAIPERVQALAQDLDRELRYLETVNSHQDIDPHEVENQINGVIAQYPELQPYLKNARQEENSGSNPAITPTLSGSLPQQSG